MCCGFNGILEANSVKMQRTFLILFFFHAVGYWKIEVIYHFAERSILNVTDISTQMQKSRTKTVFKHVEWISNFDFLIEIPNGILCSNSSSKCGLVLIFLSYGKPIFFSLKIDTVQAKVGGWASWRATTVSSISWHLITKIQFNSLVSV